MNKKTFVEKYPEFKEFISDFDITPIQKSTLRMMLKKILDKHFVRKEELAHWIYVATERQKMMLNMIEKQKVKDAIDKYVLKKWGNKNLSEELKKELVKK